MSKQETEDLYEGTDKGRRMPDSLKKHLLRVQGGKLYLPAAFRLVWFRDECPDWGIETNLLEGGQEAGFATVGARVYNSEGRLISSGLKTETKQDFPAGWCEKAETGAIARALAVAGFATHASELDDPVGELRRPADSPQAAAPAKPAAPAKQPANDTPKSTHEADLHTLYGAWKTYGFPADKSERTAVYLRRVCGHILGRDVPSRSDLLPGEIQKVVNRLPDYAEDVSARGLRLGEEFESLADTAKVGRETAQAAGR